MQTIEPNELQELTDQISILKSELDQMKKDTDELKRVLVAYALGILTTVTL